METCSGAVWGHIITDADGIHLGVAANSDFFRRAPRRTERVLDASQQLVKVGPFPTQRAEWGRHVDVYAKQRPAEVLMRVGLSRTGETA